MSQSVRTTLLMKTCRSTGWLCFSAWIVAASFGAPFESIGVEVTDQPRLAAALVQRGLHDGQVIFAIEITADGRISDRLVVEASHTELIKPCLATLDSWRFRPARFDGVPVPSRCTLTIRITQEGSVISSTAVEIAARFIEHLTGHPSEVALCSPAELDRPLEAVVRFAPPYAGEGGRGRNSKRVRVDFYVDEQGKVRLPAVAAEADPSLAHLAVEAIRNWKFIPPSRRGRAVIVAAAQEFEFADRP